jgi:hypothetical protein
MNKNKCYIIRRLYEAQNEARVKQENCVVGIIPQIVRQLEFKINF